MPVTWHGYGHDERVLCYTWGFVGIFATDGYTTRGGFTAVTDVLKVTARYEHDTTRFPPDAVTRAGNCAETDPAIFYRGFHDGAVVPFE